MSAILSADDLNDFISPGVACIKPVETLPSETSTTARDGESARPDVYEVQREELLSPDEVAKRKKVQESNAAQISLTDCLACSGCVTSAEAVLVSLQSHAEVLSILDQPDLILVASVSPQVRASIAATYGVSQRRAGWMIEQLLGGSEGLARGGQNGNRFRWIVDTNRMRDVNLVLGAEEVLQETPTEYGRSDVTRSSDRPALPILTSACPGWICYAEKTHPHVLPHLSRLKSPQALTGTLFKTMLSQSLGVHPSKIWHLSVMPCFDKKLEASRSELTNHAWMNADEVSGSESMSNKSIRDVDCVITARELLLLADSRGLKFPDMLQRPLKQDRLPDPVMHNFLFPHSRNARKVHNTDQSSEAGPSGGYLHHICQTKLASSPHSFLTTTRGRNADVIEYKISSRRTGNDHEHDRLSDDFRAARYYGFRNIQNLVRKLKPARQSRMPGAIIRSARPRERPGENGQLNDNATKSQYQYVEVMACPGGCTNGGGQIRTSDIPSQNPSSRKSAKDWLHQVDETYYSLEDQDSDNVVNDIDDETGGDAVASISPQMKGLNSASDFNRNLHSPDFFSDEINGISPGYIHSFLDYWSVTTSISQDKLVRTSFRQVESDVGKTVKKHDVKVIELASKIGGGW